MPHPLKVFEMNEPKFDLQLSEARKYKGCRNQFLFFKKLSMSQSLVITLIRSLLHFLFASLVVLGTSKILILLCLLEVEQPNIAQFSLAYQEKQFQ